MGCQALSKILCKSRVMPFRVVFTYKNIDIMEILHYPTQSSCVSGVVSDENLNLSTRPASGFA